MNLGTWVSYELFAEIQLLAERLGVSRSELLRRALAEYLKEYGDNTTDKYIENHQIRDSLDEIYSRAASNVDPVLSAVQSASIPKEYW